MGLHRWFYAGGGPNRVARILDRFTTGLSARGMGPDYLVTLEVPGRRSGRIVSLPLVIAVVDGERYLVSMLGDEVNWMRNVKAAEGNVNLRHGRREEVHLEEVAPDHRASVLKSYLERATNASAHLPIDKAASATTSRTTLGWPLVGGGVLLSRWFLQTMRQAEAPVRTDRPAPRLITEGPFRYTRNPGYLAMAMIYAGVALLRNSLSTILFLPLVLYVTRREIIGRDECDLERTFGEEYFSYKARVRRWV